METFGPYRIVGRLGAGAMGEVSRAVDDEHGRVVALKRLPPEYTDDTAFRERFRRESTIVARLSCPHVIPVHRFGEIDGRLYLDMQLVDGCDLGDLLAAEGPLDPVRVARLAEQIGAALDAAHAQGLVHRDVKPSNVLVTTSAGRDFAYLADFGIARARDGSGPSPTRSDTAIGTTEYMAPERFLGDTLDARSDVYALACVLYECLTGRRPHTVSGPALMYAHLNVEPPPPSTVRPGLPPAVDDVLAWGLRKDPAHRCRTAGDLARAVDAAVRGTAEFARSVIPGGRYLSITYVGPYDTGPTDRDEPDGLYEANAVLIGWARDRGIAFDAEESERGDRFASRLEIYRVDMSSESDPGKWVTDVAIRLPDAAA